MGSLSASAMIGQGWQLVKKQPALTIGSVLVATLVPTIITDVLPEMLGYTGLFGIVGSIISVIFSMGVIMLFLKLLRGKKAGWDELVSNYSKFFHFIGAGFITGIAVILGLILLIIPGIYIGLRLQFFGELILDKDKNLFEALSASWKLTKGYAFDLFVLGILQFLVVVAGVLALLVGVVVALPVVHASRLAAYNLMLKENKI